MSNGDYWFRRSAAASYLQSRYGFGAKSTLAKLAVVGGGPVFRRAGKIPLYTPSDLDEWALAKLSAPVRSTSDYREVA